MSKIEEALEKARIIRNMEGYPSVRKVKSINRGELGNFDEHIVTLNESDSPIAEEYRRLKSMIIRETKSNFLNTLMVTSSIDSEGKSLTSLNLAIALAQEIDHTILIVDADLRKPMIHKYLGMDYKYGLSDYLTHDIDISEIMLKTGIGNLVVIPAGRVAKNPVELLSSVRMHSLMKELKHRYMDRYIIVDTPPILPFADTIAIGPSIDGVIFVVQEGRAQISSIQEALNIIKDLNVLGVVFNNVSTANLDGHYSRYYKYNYKYREEEK